MRQTALSLFAVAVWVGAGCTAEPSSTPPKGGAGEPSAAAQPASQPGSGPSSASSLPAGHSTSSVAVDLEALFAVPEIEGDVALVVGDEKIPASDLEETLRTLQLEITAAGAPENLGRYEVLRSAVDRLGEGARRKLLAKELGVELDDKKVKAWLEELEARMKANPSFEVFLLRAGKDEAARRRDAERAVLWRQVQDEVFAQVLADSEDLARSYYEKNRSQYVEREGVETWRILIKAPRGMVQRDRDAAKSRAKNVHSMAVKSPDSFESLAKHHSDGGKGPHGGFIGWVAKGTLPEEIEKKLFAAKPNTILPLHEAPIGFYVYKAGRKRPERTKPFDEVKEEILRKVYPAKVAKRVTEHMKRLRDKYPAEVKIPELARLEAQEQARIDEVKAKMKAMEAKR